MVQYYLDFSVIPLFVLQSLCYCVSASLPLRSGFISILDFTLSFNVTLVSAKDDNQGSFCK